MITRNGGVFAPGDSPGTIPFGTYRFNKAGGVEIEVNAAGPNGTSGVGTAGVDPGWNLVTASTAFRFYPTTGQKFSTLLTSLTLGNTARAASNFDPTKTHKWEIVRLLAGANFFTAETGGSPAPASAYVPALVDIQTAGLLTNNLQGGSFSTSFEANSLGTNSVFINFTPVPEPALLLAAAGGLVALRRRRAVV